MAENIIEACKSEEIMRAKIEILPLKLSAQAVHYYFRVLLCVDADIDTAQWLKNAGNCYEEWKPHFKQLSNFAFGDVLYSLFAELPAMLYNNKGLRYKNGHLFSMRSPVHKVKSVDQYLMPIIDTKNLDYGPQRYLRMEVIVVVLARTPQYFLESLGYIEKRFFNHLCGHKSCFSPLHLGWETAAILTERAACQLNLKACVHHPKCLNLSNQGESMVFKVKGITEAKSKLKNVNIALAKFD